MCLLDSWNLLPKVMDVRMECADFPFLTGKALADRMRGEEVFVTSVDPVDEEAMDGNKNLKIIGSSSAGTDHINLEAATSRGIPVVHSPGGNADSVAEYAFGLILTVSKKIPLADALVRKGLAPEVDSMEPLVGIELKGKTMGIVGAGNIGFRVAMMAKAFGMDVLLFDPLILSTRLEQVGRPVELDELLRVSDFISIHVPLTDQTREMFGAQQFKMMKKSAFLVNTSRGKVVNEPALLEALREKRIAGAALDVQANEPLRPDSPLLKLDNVIVSPHIAAYTRESQAHCDRMVEEDIIRFTRGEGLRFIANPEVLKK